ncbi:MAG: hypothetical protein LQ337_008549 [Flavoplaca oasis]|nr:MAG: hypothetical protein LQ337_008549 [Flavoplaca oasis]
MDIMGPWLLATIKQDLDRILGVAYRLPHGSLDGAHGDDGSNVRARVSKPGIVQIIKWERYDEDYTAWISDSTIRLKAVFTPKAAAQHEKTTGTRITNDTVGNIIQLEDADVVASYSHEGPRTKKITLLINKFKVIGSDTSGQIGNPRPFDATADFEELLRNLATFRQVEGNTNRAPGGPGERPAVASRLGDFVPINSDYYGSQQLFSQMPVRHDSSGGAAITGPQITGTSRLPGWANNQTDRLKEMLEAKTAPRVSKPPLTETTPTAAAPLTSEHNAPIANIKSHLGVEGASSASPKPKNRIQRKTRQKRIRSRDLRLSKDQQDLLDSEDSWLPAKPGRRGPVANIPPAILEEIIQSMKAKAVNQKTAAEEGPIKASPERTAERLVEEELEEAAEAQPEVLISSQDWPASSPDPTSRRELNGRKLPPDSSPMDADDMDLDDDSDVQHGGSSPVKALSSDETQEPHSTPAEGEDSSNRKSIVISIDSTESEESGKENTTARGVDSSESESELETSVLLGLEEQEMPAAEPLYTQEVPATAIQPQESYLQVKRTPYGALGHDTPLSTGTQLHAAPERFSSPSKRRRTDESSNVQNFRDTDGQTHTSLDSEKSHGLDEAACHLTQSHNSGVDETSISHVAQQKAPSPQSPPKIAAALVPATLVTPVDNQEETAPKARHPILSPHVSKRRKVHKASINFGFSQDEIPEEDPSVTARRYREEYMARRKVPHSETRTSPCNVGLETSSKPERDNNARKTDPEQSYEIIDKEERSPNTQGAANDSEIALDDPEASQDEVHRSNQRYDDHEHVSSPEDAASLHPVAKFPAEVSEANSTSEIGMLVKPSPQRPVNPKHGQSNSVLEDSDVRDSLNNVTTKLETIPSTEVSQQSHGSGQAQSLPELMTPALSHTDLPDLPTVVQHTDTQAAFYLEFKSVYPEYGGSKEDFLGMCKKIEHLFRSDRMEHKSLWDDFVIRYQMDYPQYLEHCVKNFEDPKAYERFYRDEIDEPKFNSRVLLPSTLGRALISKPNPRAATEDISMDNVATGVSSRAKPGVQRTVSPWSTSRSSPVLGAVDKTSEQIPKLSSRRLHIWEDGDYKHDPEDQARESSAERHEDQLKIPQNGGMEKSVLRSSVPSLPPAAVQTFIDAKDSVSTPPRRLPWLRDATASEDTSKRDGTLVPLRRQHCLKRPQYIISLSDEKPTRLPRDRSSGTDTKNVHHSQQQVSEQMRPGTSDGLHTAKSGDTKTPVEDAMTLGLRGPRLPRVDAPNVDERWKDHPTSLRGFTKFYQVIKPGRGNSWAPAEDRKNPMVETNVATALRMRSVDVMSWRL